MMTNSRAHKGTDKWFALGDELASQPPPPDMKTTQEQEAIQRTRKVRRTIIVGLAMLPIAVVALALLVATVHRHLDRTSATPALAVTVPAPTAEAAQPRPPVASAPATTAPSPVIAKPETTSTVAAINHPSRTHHKQAREHASRR